MWALVKIFGGILAAGLILVICMAVYYAAIIVFTITGIFAAMAGIYTIYQQTK